LHRGRGVYINYGVYNLIFRGWGWSVLTYNVSAQIPEWLHDCQELKISEYLIDSACSLLQCIVVVTSRAWRYSCVDYFSVYPCHCDFSPWLNEYRLMGSCGLRYQFAIGRQLLYHSFVSLQQWFTTVVRESPRVVIIRCRLMDRGGV
jgi:hypothetical protein